MTQLFFIYFIVYLLIAYATIKIVTKRKLPEDVLSFDRGSYELILGLNAKQLFFHYRQTVMYGLTLEEASMAIDNKTDYIDSLCNYNPRDKNACKSPMPFIFLNISSLQNNYSMNNIDSCIMGECMHMAGIIYDGCWDSHENEMIEWAKNETNKIVSLLKELKYI
jgi:hypothetical protein